MFWHQNKLHVSSGLPHYSNHIYDLTLIPASDQHLCRQKVKNRLWDLKSYTSISFTLTLLRLRNIVSLAGSELTLELVLVLIGALVLSDQDLGGHVQTDHAWVRHQEEHDKLLAHYSQGFVLPTVHRRWRETGGIKKSGYCATQLGH